ncbi:hypothetical protein ACFQ9V_17560 [Leifsonia sp. NPDC056665]|uniref:hypothetical protein n=1 Tax=Leifsonia sp. NPDC056665 TaxID=3345901 RepID=UPI0036D1D725
MSTLAVWCAAARLGGLLVNIRHALASVMTVTAVAAVSLAGVGWAGPALAAGCVIPTSDVSTNLTDTTSGSNTSVSGNDSFLWTTGLSHLDGLANGCTTTVSIDPSLFYGLQSTTLYLNADGTSSATQHTDSVAAMAVDPASNTITFTLTSYAATHTSVSAHGFVTAVVTESIKRGVSEPVVATVNGVSVPVGSITGAVCTTNCPALPTAAAKWGWENTDGTGVVKIQSPTVKAAGTTVTFKDTLTAHEQTIVGPQSAIIFDCADVWGAPGLLQPDGSCQPGWDTVPFITNPDGTFLVTTTGPSQAIQLWLDMTFTGPGPWTDAATITVDGTPWTATTTVTSYSVGGGANGNNPTPTPTPTPVHTPAPTPIPTVLSTPTAPATAAVPVPSGSSTLAPATTTGATVNTGGELASKGYLILSAAAATLALGAGLALLTSALIRRRRTQP